MSKEDRDQQILRRIANIENEVRSIDETNAFALRAEKEKHMGFVDEIFGKSVRRVQIYLLADGTRSVQDIADELVMKISNVSPQLKLLKEEGLITIIDKEGGNIIYGKKRIDKTLRISKYLMEKFDIDKNGKEVK